MLNDIYIISRIKNKLKNKIKISGKGNSIIRTFGILSYHLSQHLALEGKWIWDRKKIAETK